MRLQTAVQIPTKDRKPQMHLGIYNILQISGAEMLAFLISRQRQTNQQSNPCPSLATCSCTLFFNVSIASDMVSVNICSAACSHANVAGTLKPQHEAIISD